MILSMRIPAAGNMKWRVAAVICLTAGVAGMVWTVKAARMDGLNPGDMAGVLGFGAGVLSLLVGLVGTAIGWFAFRADRREYAECLELVKAADGLARAVRAQWAAETQVRRLNDPYPLSVPWQPAPADLVEPWPLLRSTALSWPGCPPGGSPRWAANPTGLAGSDSAITEVFAQRVPTRRLVVLGPPGAGKTMLLVRLLLGLLEERADSGRGPVPVLFSIASWSPNEQDLHDWLAGQLATHYAGLEERAPSRDGLLTRGRALLDDQLVLPILDGFDELPVALRSAALDKINQALPLGQGLILSSRPEEYRHAVLPASGLPVKLASAAGIALTEVDPAHATDYLERDAGGAATASAARWAPVIAHLGTGDPISQALSTPLMLFLARTVYNPRPGEHSATLPDPAELCDTTRLPTRTAIQAHLFDAFIPAAYRGRPGHSSRWRPEEAEQALVFLARHVQHRLHGTPDIAWWQLHHSVRPRGLRLAPTITLALVAWCMATALGYAAAPSIGLSSGLLAAVMVTLAIGLPQTTPTTGMRWSWNLKRAVPGIAAGLGFGFIVMRPITALSSASYGFGIVLGLVTGAVAALTTGGTSLSADHTIAVDPGELLRQDRRTHRKFALVGTAAGALMWPVVFGVMAWLASPVLLVASVFIGLVFAVAFGLVYASARTACGTFAVARWTFALRRQLPSDLMAFLADAHEKRGVLRRVGSAYQFRHIDLQQRLSNRP